MFEERPQPEIEALMKSNPEFKQLYQRHKDLVDEIILFHPLMKTEIKGIINIQLNALKSLVNQSGVHLEFTDYLVDYLAENGFDPQYGARPLKRLIQKAIVNQLSKRILAGDIDKSKPVLVDVFDGVVVFRNEVPEKVK